MNTAPHSSSRSETQRAGQMTRAMRAVAPAGETVLRVGLVREGRVVEERKLERGQSLSIGSSEKCDLTIGAASAPRFWRAFTWTKRGPRLHLSDRVSGRVVTKSGACDLTELHRGIVDLERGSRGKLVVGDVALLFQLVVESPRPQRPQLPLSLKSRPIDIDWMTTIVGALSFLLHFAVVGTLYSDWADPVLDDDVVISGLVGALTLPVPPIVEHAEPSESPTATTAAATPGPQPIPKTNDKRGSSQSAPVVEQPGLGRELEAIALETIGTLGREGPATRDVLRDGDLPLGPLDEAARDARGVSGPADLAVTSGRVVRPGSEGQKLADLGNTRREDSADTGHLERPRGPTGNVSVTPPTKTGIVPNAESAIYALRGAFRQCYQRGLDDYPDAEGAVRLTFTVGANGEPTNVSAASSGNLPSSIASCIQTRARSAQFDPPEGGSAVVIAPVILRKQ